MAQKKESKRTETNFIYKGNEKEYKKEYWQKYYKKKKSLLNKINGDRLKERRLKDPEFRKSKIEYNKEYYKNNKEKFNIRTEAEVKKRNDRRRELYATNPEYRERAKKQSIQAVKRNPETRFKNQLKKLYGITLEDYKKIHEQQNGGCAICGSKSALLNSHQRLHVDHCHETKKVRGLLCINCNQGIGKFGDDIDLLFRAIEYLKKSESESMAI